MPPEILSALIGAGVVLGLAALAFAAAWGALSTAITNVKTTLDGLSAKLDAADLGGLRQKVTGQESWLHDLDRRIRELERMQMARSDAGD